MQSFPNYSHKSHFFDSFSQISLLRVTLANHTFRVILTNHTFPEPSSQITLFESSSQIALSNSLHYKHPNNKNIPKTPPPPLGERNFYF